MLNRLGIITREPGDIDINTTNPELIEFGKQQQIISKATNPIKIHTGYLDDIFETSGNKDLIAILQHAHSQFILNGVSVCFFNRRDTIEYKKGPLIYGDPLFTIRAKQHFYRDKDNRDCAAAKKFFEGKGLVYGVKPVREFLDKTFERFVAAN